MKSNKTQFCKYYFVKFYGKAAPVELKSVQHGFVLCGPWDKDWFKIKDELKGLYKSLRKHPRCMSEEDLLDEYRFHLEENAKEDENLNLEEILARATEEMNNPLLR